MVAIWLMAADGSGARQISEDGHETGWARWSPDGRFVVFTSYRRDKSGARHGGLYVIGVDQETGEVAEPQNEVPLGDFALDVIQAEWADSGETLLFEAAEAVGRKPLDGVPRGRRADPLSQVRVGPDPFRDRGLAGRPVGGLHRPRRRRLLPGVPGPARRGRSGTSHLGPHSQDPASVVAARRSDRVYRLQLPLPLLADPSVLAPALIFLLLRAWVNPFEQLRI